MAQREERGNIIVVSRNNLHLTRKTVASALAQNMPVDVLLLDNASKDGTVQWAATKDRVALIAFQKQQSLAACWNYALRSVFKRYDHALVLNNDVEIRSDTYSMLLGHGGQFVTCVSVDSVDRIGTPGDRDLHDIQPGARRHPDFSCFMIRKECFERINGFREDCYPAYVEDCFAHIAMHRARIEAVCIDLPFLHHGAGTVKHADPAERAVIQKGADANRQRFNREYGCMPGTAEYEALFR